MKCIITFLIAEIFKYVLDLTSKLAMRQRGLQLSLKNGNITPITMFFHKLVQKVFAMLSVWMRKGSYQKSKAEHRKCAMYLRIFRCKKIVNCVLFTFLSFEKWPGRVLLHFQVVWLQLLAGNCHDKYFVETNRNHTG